MTTELAGRAQPASGEKAEVRVLTGWEDLTREEKREGRNLWALQQVVLRGRQVVLGLLPDTPPRTDSRNIPDPVP